jgi:membrane-associated phospholipid phosphatase
MRTLALPLPSTPARGSTVRFGLGLCSSLIFVYVLLDALLRPHAFYDIWVLRAIQPIDERVALEVMPVVEPLTDSHGAIVSWLVVLAIFLALRQWVWLGVAALIPIGGVVSLACAAAVARPRPQTYEIYRWSLNPEPGSFPSGHAMGAVMLYGLLFVAAAGLRNPIPRTMIRLICVAIIAACGFQRIWSGAHWPSDVIGGYALGAALLACLLTVYAWLSTRVATREWPPVALAIHAEIVSHLPGARTQDTKIG